MAWKVSVVLFALSACVTTPTPRPTQAARMYVELTIPERGPLDVHVRVPREFLTPRPSTYEFEFSGVPAEYATRAIRGVPNKVTASANADLVLDYQVTVSTMDAHGEEHRLNVAFDTAQGRYLPIWSLLPQIQGVAVDGRLTPVQLTVKSPMQIASSLPGSGNTFWADDVNVLYSSLVLAGPLVAAEGSPGVRVVSFDFSQRAVQRFAELERAVSGQLALLTGPRGPLSFVALLRAPRTMRAGRYGTNFTHGAVAVLAHHETDGSALSPDGSTFVHELAHSSLPHGGNLPHWMVEGFTEYYALRVGLTVDGFPRGALQELLTQAWSEFERVNPTLRAGGSTLGDYSAGMVLAHCIDVRLRRDHSSIDTVLKTIRAQSGEVTNDLWEQQIALTSAPAGARIVSARFDPLDPPESCFQEEGLRRQLRGQAPSFERLCRWLGIRQVLRDRASTGIVVETVTPGSRFQSGDWIAAVDDQRVIGIEHFRELMLRGRTVWFVRDGVMLRAEVQLPPLTEDDVAPLERERWLSP